jgi:hypothetical protein
MKSASGRPINKDRIANTKPKRTKRPPIELNVDVESGGRIQASTNTTEATTDAVRSEVHIRMRADSVRLADEVSPRGSSTLAAGGVYGLRSIDDLVTSIASLSAQYRIFFYCPVQMQ